MGRLWTAGGELFTWNNPAEYPDGFGSPAPFGGSSIDRDTGKARSGASSWRARSTGSNGGAGIGKQITRVASRSYYFRMYYCFTNLPDSTISIMVVGGAVSARITLGGKIQFWNDSASSQIGSDSSVTISADGTTWYRIEIGITLNSSTQIASCELRLNGDTVASTSGLTLTCSVNNDAGWATAPGANKQLNMDDAALNDSTGTYNTSWPGDGKVVLLSPISDNARTGWLNGAGGTGNLYDDVNNIPPVGVASPSAQPSQIKDVAANTTDTYEANLTTYENAGIGGNDTLNDIRIWACGGQNVASSFSTGVSMTSNPTISEATFGTAASAAGTYPTNWTWGGKNQDFGGTVSSNVTVSTSPVAKVRKNTSDGTNSQFCCALFAYVDYTPSGVTLTTIRPDADVADGGWTTTPLWSKVDEVSAGGDVISATAAAT